MMENLHRTILKVGCASGTLSILRASTCGPNARYIVYLNEVDWLGILGLEEDADDDEDSYGNTEQRSEGDLSFDSFDDALRSIETYRWWWMTPVAVDPVLLDRRL